MIIQDSVVKGRTAAAVNEYRGLWLEKDKGRNVLRIAKEELLKKYPAPQIVLAAPNTDREL